MENWGKFVDPKNTSQQKSIPVFYLTTEVDNIALERENHCKNTNKMVFNKLNKAPGWRSVWVNVKKQDGGENVVFTLKVLHQSGALNRSSGWCSDSTEHIVLNSSTKCFVSVYTDVKQQK